MLRIARKFESILLFTFLFFFCHGYVLRSNFDPFGAAPRFFLTSCGGGSITVAGKAQLIGSRDYDGYVITNAVALPGHTFAYGRVYE